MFRVPSYVLFAISHTVIYTDRCVRLYSDGATKSGLFCAICDTISRMTSDGEIDVYMAARNVHIVRPESVSSEVYLNVNISYPQTQNMKTTVGH